MERNNRRSEHPCANIFMQVESGTKLQWDITKFLKGKEKWKKRWKRRGWVGWLEFILEKANTVEYTIHAQTPVHHFSIHSPLSILRNANGGIGHRGALVFSKYPIGIPKTRGISNNQLSIPFRSSLPLFARNSAFIFRESDHGRGRGGKDIRVDFTAAPGQRRYFTPLKRGNSGKGNHPRTGASLEGRGISIGPMFSPLKFRLCVGSIFVKRETVKIVKLKIWKKNIRKFRSIDFVWARKYKFTRNYKIKDDLKRTLENFVRSILYERETVEIVKLKMIWKER